MVADRYIVPLSASMVRDDAPTEAPSKAELYVSCGGQEWERLPQMICRATLFLIFSS
jgi:hypothetical protein